MIPHSLQESLRDGKVIPFVGAGVSMAVRRRADGQPLFPNWRDLLLGAADRLGQEGKPNDADLVRALLRIGSPKYLQAAEHARDQLGPTWVEYLKQRLDPPSGEVDPESLALARGVWTLANRLIVTTNYDRVLAWACPEHLKGDLDLWDIQRIAEQARFLRNSTPDKPTIWHLHGQISNAADLILTPDGYQRLYPEGPDQKQRFAAALATFQQVLTSRSFLFVGFSFQDAHLGLELRGVQELFEGIASKHYALVHEKDISLLRTQNLPVELIPFEDFGDPLLLLIRQLAEIQQGAGVLGSSSPALISPPPSIVSLDTTVSMASQGAAAPYSPANPPFNVPFRPKEDRVIGREKALEDVRRQLTQGKPTAIGQTASFEGIGGLGKTQLAVEYAWRYRDNYPNGIIWINADQDIDAQLTSLAVEAKWVAPESEHKVKLDVAKHRLRSYSGCLIIFDNLEDFAAIEPYLPAPGTQPHLLATSRDEQPMFSPVELDLLDKEQSLQLLIQEAGRSPEELDDQEAAAKIVENLQGLPLALEMAGAYLHHRRLLTWRQYLEMLESNLRVALRSNLLASFTRHYKDLSATLKIQEGVFQDEPLLGEILDVLTWSSPRSMGLSLLSALLKTDEVLLRSPLALGHRLRILDLEEGTDRYILHRLVSRVRREEAPLEHRKDWAEEIFKHLGDWFETRRQDFADLPQFEAEIDHLRAWQEHAVRLDSPQTSRLIWLEAYPAYHRGLYRESRDYVVKAINYLRESENPRLAAWLWNDLGVTTVFLGDYQKALEYDQKALRIRLEFLGEQHPDTATSLDNVGGTYSHLGDYKRALEFQLKALAIRRSIFGEQHPDTATSLDNVGTTYSDLADYRNSLEFSLRALEIRRNILGKQHPDTARTLFNIGRTYSYLGVTRKALELALEALTIYKNEFGEQHPNTATGLANVGSIYSNLRENRRALKLALEALEIRRTLLGEQHPDTARSLANVGTCYSNSGEHQKALEFELKALEIRTDLLGGQHPDTAKTLENVGIIYSYLDDNVKALEFEFKALGILKNVFGEQHLHTANSINNIGTCYGRLQENQKALENYQKALEIRTKVLGEHHPDTAQSVINTTRRLMLMNRRQEAFALLESYLQQLPSDHPSFYKLKELKNELLSKPLRPGFRQPPSKKKTNKKRK